MMNGPRSSRFPQWGVLPSGVPLSRVLPSGACVAGILALCTACPSGPEPGSGTEGNVTDTADPGPDDGPGTADDPDSGDPDTNDTNDPDSGDTDDPAGLGGECPLGERVGAFDVILEEQYSAINGEIRGALIQTQILSELAAEGECRLLTVENPFCDPPCGGGEVCTNEAQCAAFPPRIEVGTVTITGLEVPVSMEPQADQRYFETELPHPVITPGIPIELTADGLNLSGHGFSALADISPVLAIAPKTDLDVTWEAEGGEAHVRLEINIDQHGISPATLYCDVPDTGSYTVPAALIDALMLSGISGFPAGTVYRQTIDSTNGPSGCVEFRVRARSTTEVSVAGHTACNVPEDCPPGQTCNVVIQTCE